MWHAREQMASVKINNAACQFYSFKVDRTFGLIRNPLAK